jgi:hypothetical protein
VDTLDEISALPRPYPCSIRLTDSFVRLDELAAARGWTSLDRLFPPSLRCELARKVRAASHSPATGPRAAEDSALQVVMHVRRGDVDAARLRVRHRFMPDEYFILFKQLLQSSLSPGVPVAFHVHSSTSPEQPASSFRALTDSGFAVHLDAPMVDSWLAMMSADILVISKSSFSYVPALLSRGVVFFTPFWHMPLGHWVSTSAVLLKRATWIRDVTPAQPAALLPLTVAQNRLLDALRSMMVTDATLNASYPGTRRPRYPEPASQFLDEVSDKRVTRLRGKDLHDSIRRRAHQLVRCASFPSPLHSLHTDPSAPRYCASFTCVVVSYGNSSRPDPPLVYLFDLDTPVNASTQADLDTFGEDLALAASLLLAAHHLLPGWDGDDAAAPPTFVVRSPVLLDLLAVLGWPSRHQILHLSDASRLDTRAILWQPDPSLKHSSLRRDDPFLAAMRTWSPGGAGMEDSLLRVHSKLRQYDAVAEVVNRVLSAVGPAVCDARRPVVLAVVEPEQSEVLDGYDRVVVPVGHLSLQSVVLAMQCRPVVVVPGELHMLSIFAPDVAVVIIEQSDDDAPLRHLGLVLEVLKARGVQVRTTSDGSDDEDAAPGRRLVW